MQPNPEATFTERAARFAAQGAAHARKAARIADLRLLVFAAGIGAAVWAFYGSALGLAAFAVAVVVFAALLRIHSDAIAAQARAEALAAINAASLARLRDGWHAFADTGAEFAAPEHRYAGDLDLFGPGSLYQFLGGGASFEGRRALAGLLLAADENSARFLDRQAAVRELAPELDWRQDVLAAAAIAGLAQKAPAPLLDWSRRQEGAVAPWFRKVAFVTPGLTLLAAALAWGGFLGWGPFSALVVLQLALFLTQAKRLLAEGERLRKAGAVAEGYGPFLAVLGARVPRATLLHDAHERLAGAPVSMQRLTGLTAWLEVQRIGLVHLVLNAVCLWDAQFLAAAERWRARHGAAVADWLAAATELEGYVVTAALPFDFPAWSFPTQGEGGVVRAAVLGHPLIAAATRVANPVALDAAGRVLVVTGSNMSGKSTYMRTVGVNLVLAYLGAPVCGQDVRCAPVGIYTSMRNVDSLEKRMSSFYAELARIKGVIDASDARSPLVFLFDEIFRGTNSVDRLSGAREVLRRLSAAGACGVVTTHDLDLARLAADDPDHFVAAHFAESYAGTRIVFDFRLRPGVATSRNAVVLMRLVGILPSGDA